MCLKKWNKYKNAWMNSSTALKGGWHFYAKKTPGCMEVYVKREVQIPQ